MDRRHPVMRIGTRKSDLALAQARMLAEACSNVEHTFCWELAELMTAGDAIQNRPLYAFEGKGMFVSAFEKALLEGEMDVAVHSGKDMPVDMPPELITGAVLPRGNPMDVLVTVRGKWPAQGGVIGTASLRRREQVKQFMGCKTQMVRGNVITRLQKLLAGEVDGLILAAAGLERLALLPGETQGRGPGGADGREPFRGAYGTLSRSAIRERFSFQVLEETTFLPAAAQGIIAVQCRRDSPYRGLLAQVNDRETMYSFLAERAFLRVTGADCHQPAAAYSRCRDGILQMDAAYWQDGTCFRSSVRGPAEQSEALGREAAEKIMAVIQGAGNGNR